LEYKLVGVCNKSLVIHRAFKRKIIPTATAQYIFKFPKISELKVGPCEIWIETQYQ